MTDRQFILTNGAGSRIFFLSGNLLLASRQHQCMTLLREEGEVSVDGELSSVQWRENREFCQRNGTFGTHLPLLRLLDYRK